MIGNFLKRTFNIHEGEVKIALLMQLYIFLIITVLLLVKPTITALFLSHLGSAKLPYAYLLVAVVAMSSSFFYNWLILRFPIKSVAATTIVLFSICFFILSYIIDNSIISNWVLYFYYLSFALFGVMVTSQFWVIANIIFDMREAKRLFGFIGAGAIAGGIIGGYLTTLITTFFGNGMVILIAAIILLLCLPIIFIVWKIRVEKLNKYIKEKRKTRKKTVFSSSLKLVLESKHLLNLALVVGVSVVVAKLIDYQFNDYSHRVYTHPHDLASFFGFWFSSFNIVAIVIQLFLTNRLLARFGVSSNMLLLPLSLALGSFLFFIFPELWVVILIKGIDVSFKQSINKASFELSILPVPYETKQLTKPFIDVVVDSVATGLAGFLLIFVIIKLNIDSSYITLIILFFLFVWFLLIYRLRETYFEAFRKNIKSLIVDASDQKESKTVASKTSIIDVFQTGSEEEIVRLLYHSDGKFTDVYMPYLVNLLDHPSNRVKVSALKEVHTVKNKLILEKVQKFIEKTKDDELVYEAMEYLLLHSSSIKSKVVYYYLDHEKDYIKDAALLCLANASRYNKTLEKKYDLNKRIESQIAAFSIDENSHRKEEIAELLLTIGYSGNRAFDPFIEKHLACKVPLLVTYAIKAAGLSKHEIFIDKLVSLIRKEKYRKEVIKALHGFGEPIVKILFKKDEDEDLADDIRAYIPSIIESFKTRQSVVVLSHLLNSKDVVVRLNASKVLDNIEDENHRNTIPDKKLIQHFYDECDYFKNTLTGIQTIENSIKIVGNKISNNSEIELEEQVARDHLRSHLQIQSNESLETIFNLLSLKYKNSDMEVVFLGIKNETETSKINAIEFLENLLNTDFKNKLLPLLEYSFLDNTEAGLNIKGISESNCLINLLDERGADTKIHVLNLMQYHRNKSFAKSIKELEKHKNPKVMALAKKNIRFYSK